MRFSLSIRNRLILTVVVIILGLGMQLLVTNASQNNIDYLQSQQSLYLTRDASISSVLNGLIVETNQIINVELQDYLSGLLQNSTASEIQALTSYEFSFRTALDNLNNRNKDGYKLDTVQFSEVPFLYSMDQSLLNKVDNLVDTSTNGTYSTISFIQIQVRSVIDLVRSSIASLKTNYIEASSQYYSNYTAYISNIEIFEDAVFNLQRSILNSSNQQYIQDGLAIVTDLLEVVHQLSTQLLDFNLSFLGADATNTNYTTIDDTFNSVIKGTLDSVIVSLNNLTNFGLTSGDQNLLNSLYTNFNTTILDNLPIITTSVNDFINVRAEVGQFQDSQFIKAFRTTQQGISNTKAKFEAEHLSFLETYSELQKQTISAAQNVTLLITLILAAFVAAFALPAVVKISTTTRRLEKNFRRVSSGDLSFTLKNVTGDDEFANLEKSFNQLVVDWRDIVGVIQESSSQLAGISEELAAGTEEASATLTSISDTVRTISIGAQNQNDLVEALRNNMFELRKEIQNATSGIEQASSNVTKLAQRTNILGLNAAISAAKAGGSASGFGIVANEIRELAINSRRSVI